MADDDTEIPERERVVSEPPRDPVPAGRVSRSEGRGAGRTLKRWALIVVGLLIVLPLAGFALIAAISLSFSYSDGDRAGYQQKISRKGWLCKTWEGEIAMTTSPGTAPVIFSYTVRDDAVAKRLAELQGRQVSVFYEEHRFVPTSCFGDTPFYVKSVRAIEPLAPVAPVPAPTPVPAPVPTTP